LHYQRIPPMSDTTFREYSVEDTKASVERVLFKPLDTPVTGE